LHENRKMVTICPCDRATPTDTATATRPAVTLEEMPFRVSWNWAGTLNCHRKPSSVPRSPFITARILHISSSQLDPRHRYNQSSLLFFLRPFTSAPNSMPSPKSPSVTVCEAFKMSLFDRDAPSRPASLSPSVPPHSFWHRTLSNAQQVLRR